MIGLTAGTIKSAYQTLQAAKRSYAAAAAAETECERRLEDARLRAIADGRITGKNEAERAAMSHMLLADLIAEFQSRQDRTREARLAMELAALEVECLRTELRLLELAATEAAQ